MGDLGILHFHFKRQIGFEKFPAIPKIDHFSFKECLKVDFL